MASEFAEAIGAACHRQVMHDPGIVYGTQFDRFGWTVPPNPLHEDCSGAASHVYWDAVRVKIGADTGGVARDVEAGKASWVNVNAVTSGMLVMRRSGSRYDGGPDEHIGIFLYRLSDGRPVTFESAGSKNGVGYYPRPTNFWRDGVAYPVARTPQGPIEVPEEEHTMPARIISDGSSLYWYTGSICRNLIGEELVFHQAMLKDAGLPSDPIQGSLIVDRCVDLGIIRGGPKDKLRLQRKGT